MVEEQHKSIPDHELLLVRSLRISQCQPKLVACGKQAQNEKHHGKKPGLLLAAPSNELLACILTS